MVRISDIAKDMGLSEATISNALSGSGRMRQETRDAVRARAAAMGYVPVRRSRRQASNRLIVIAEDIRLPFVPEIIEGIRAEAAAHDLYPPLYSLGYRGVRGMQPPSVEDLNRAVASLLGNLNESVSGILYISQYPRLFHGLLSNLDIPSVCTLCTRDDDAPFVHYDDKQGAYLAVEALVKSGCRRIAMISGPIDSVGMIHRTNGCQRALIDGGLAFDPTLMKIGDWSARSGHAIARALLSERPDIDAIFAQNDTMAVGAMHAIHGAGLRIPSDISIVGFDDAQHARACIPALTSVAPPYAEMGRAAFRSISRLTERSKLPAESQFLPCSLVRRDSTRNEADAMTEPTTDTAPQAQEGGVSA